MDSPVVSNTWLNKHIDDPELIILEVYQKINKAGLEFDKKGHIKGSILVDLKADFSDTSGQYSNTFPTKEIFENTCKRLDIQNTSKVIIVDRLGIYTSPRLWYIFKTMGHTNVAVLDGGLPAWITEGFEVVEKNDLPNEESSYTAHPNLEPIKSIDHVRNNIDNEDSLLIDARSSRRFLGTQPELRKGIQSGCIPNSVNIPFKSLLEGGKYKSKEALLSIFKKVNLGSKELIFSCGSGVTACILLLAAQLVSDNKSGLYDGSWTEWADKNDLKS